MSSNFRLQAFTINRRLKDCLITMSANFCFWLSKQAAMRSFNCTYFTVQCWACTFYFSIISAGGWYHFRNFFVCVWYFAANYFSHVIFSFLFITEVYLLVQFMLTRNVPRQRWDFRSFKPTDVKFHTWLIVGEIWSLYPLFSKPLGFCSAALLKIIQAGSIFSGLLTSAVTEQTQRRPIPI